MTLTPKQIEALDILTLYPNVLLYGGARSGKTVIALFYIIGRAITKRSRHLVARKFASDIRSSVWRDTLTKVLGLMDIKMGLHYKANDTSMLITFTNGSEIVLAGLDDKERVDKILGEEFATIYINESNDVPYSTVKRVVSRLSMKVEGVKKNPDGTEKPYGRFIVDLNPGSTAHWTYKLWFGYVDPTTQEPLKDAGTYKALQMNPYDNEINIAEGYIKARLETMSGDERNRFYLGEYQSNTDLRVFNPKAYYQWNEFEAWVGGQWGDIRLVGGLDLGYQDADAFAIIAYRNGYQDTWVLHEHKARRQDISALADAIKSGMLSIFNKMPSLPVNDLIIYSDTNTIRSGLEGDQKKNWRLLNEVYGLHCKPARKTGLALSVEILREDINAGRCHIMRGGSLDDETDQTVWTKNKITGDIERIIDDEVYHPDIIHAVRYGYNFLTSPQGNPAMIGREFRKDSPEYVPSAIRQAEMINKEADKLQANYEIFARSDEDW